jgi:adenylate cyclase
MRVLRQYHETMGALVHAHEGTLERFTGDGFMVFFNDPVPQPDPALRAVTMAVAMRDRMVELCAAWRRRGHQLGHGIGIALGYATAGRIGFEGRYDYAAIGPVTNLAGRLSSAAADAQILVSQRVHAEVEHLVEATPVEPPALKGVSRLPAVYAIARLKTTDQLPSPLLNASSDDVRVRHPEPARDQPRPRTPLATGAAEPVPLIAPEGVSAP